MRSGQRTPLFHGTGHWFQPGDVVEPRHRDDFYGPNAYDSKGYRYEEGDGVGAYASTDIADAERFAKQAMEFQLSTAIQQRVPHQLEMLAPIFPVEHLSEHRDPLNRLIERERPTYRRDKEGFRVTGGPVGFVGRDYKADEDSVKYADWRTPSPATTSPPSPSTPLPAAAASPQFRKHYDVPLPGV